MKKILACLSILLITVGLQAAKPKYVFYFIGDGMGTNHVLMTEMYLASLEGNVGVKPLCFTQFPVASVSMTWSADRNVTDSPAAGTALATGEKTRNGAAVSAPFRVVSHEDHRPYFLLNLSTRPLVSTSFCLPV